MIRKNIEMYCKDYTKIENYEIALNREEIFIIHHRLETHNSDGERRLIDLSKKELIALDMYYHRPAEELIFLTRSEHQNIHHKGKHHSEKWKKKFSEFWKGKHWKLVYGKRVWY